MIKNVLFDLDGTLLDTSKGIIESVQYTIGVMNFCELSEQEMLSFIGPPLRQSFMKTCGCTAEEAQQATNVFRTYYQASAVLHAKQYEGILELCKTLASKYIKMGVATNKPQRFADALLNEFHLTPYFLSVCGADESGSLSKTDLIRLCMKRMEISETETVLIGDTENDAVGAQKAGVGFIAVTFGFGFKDAKELDDYHCIGIADTPLQVADIICNKS